MLACVSVGQHGQFDRREEQRENVIDKDGGCRRVFSRQRVAAGAASAQVKVGAVLSVTGPASFLGDPEKRTLELYVDEINAKGGVNGQKLQLVVYDDGADANAARTFATRLIEEDKVVAMIGGTTTARRLP
jgi:ABC-type branched-chain amino acid transport systems, periplasmic component